MVYEVHVIRETDLPEGQAWALVAMRDRVLLLVKERALEPPLLAEIWAGVRAVRDGRMLARIA